MTPITLSWQSEKHSATFSKCCKRFEPHLHLKQCAACRLSGKLYGALLKEQPDLPETNAQSIILKHVAGIARRKTCRHQFTFEFIDKDKKGVLPAEHSRVPLSAVHCGSFRDLPPVLQIKGTYKIKSMCGAARWLLQQVWLGLCTAARLCKQCAAAAVSEGSGALSRLGCFVRPAASRCCGR